jgi:hypothetical protein
MCGRVKAHGPLQTATTVAPIKPILVGIKAGTPLDIG